MADLKLMTGDGMSQYTDKLKVKLRWSGTRTEYDAIATKDPYTSYYITDQKKLIRNGIEYGEPTNFLSDVAVDGDKLTITKINGGVSSTKDFDMSGKATTSALNGHISDTANPHGVTKKQVGLEFADNTADSEKPVSTAQQNALDTKVDKVDGFGLSKITLNGNSAQEATFYAPTSAGEAGSYVTVKDDGTVGWQKISSAMVFKGDKKGSELAAGTSWAQGDTYYCSEDYTTSTPAFTKGYVYTYVTGSGFSNVGTVADLTAYLKIKQFSTSGNKLLYVNGSGEIAPYADISTTDLNKWLTGTTSNIQTQITNNKVSFTQVKTSGNAIGRITIGSTTTTLYETPVDSSLSSSSTNPVQNKVLKVEIDNLKNNKQDAVAAQGSANQPVYTSSIGRFATCNQYAGGTAVSINGTSYASKSLSLTFTNSLIAFNEAPTMNQEYTLGDSVTNYAFVVIIYYTPSGAEFSSEILMPDYNGKNIIHVDFDDKFAQVIISGNKFKFTKASGGMYPCRVYGVLKKA